MSILLNPILSRATEKNFKRPRSKSIVGYSPESFILPDVELAEANLNDAVVVDVSEEGHRLLDKDPADQNGELHQSISTAAFMKSRL